MRLVGFRRFLEHAPLEFQQAELAVEIEGRVVERWCRRHADVLIDASANITRRFVFHGCPRLTAVAPGCRACVVR